MSKFIQLSVFTGLLGLASTLVACGSEVSEEEAAEASPKEICEHMASKMEDEDVDMEKCEEGVKEMKDALGDKWEDVAKCLVKAESEKDAEKCAMAAMGAMMEKAGEEMEKELEKLDADK